jgi:glycerophosphoryl diester phosphodiesterase
VRVLGRISGPIVIGHRGGRGEGWPPENTLASFERARAEGAHAVELDVRLAGTGEVVVIHDATLARVTNGRDARSVAELPWSELSRATLGTSNERVPRLDDVLTWASESQMPVNVEIKHDVPHRPALVRAVAREVRRREASILVSSFDPLLLLGLRLLAPRVACALLTDPRQTYAEALHAIARPPFVVALHVERRQAMPRDIARWKQRGLAVGVWTVNDPREAVRLVEAGVDILITDEPRRILEATLLVPNMLSVRHWDRRGSIR